MYKKISKDQNHEKKKIKAPKLRIKNGLKYIFDPIN